MQLSKVLETLTSEERTGSVPDPDSARHQESTVAASSIILKREPIRVDYIKCKSPSKFAKAKMNGSPDTHLNSVYEEMTSPRLEQRFDVKLDAKYVRAFKLRSEKKGKLKRETPISVVGFSMK